MEIIHYSLCYFVILLLCVLLSSLMATTTTLPPAAVNRAQDQKTDALPNYLHAINHRIRRRRRLPGKITSF